MPNREQLIREYDRLSLMLEKAGAEPVVSTSVLDVFSDTQLAELVSYTAFRLVRIGRLEA